MQFTAHVIPCYVTNHASLSLVIGCTCESPQYGVHVCDILWSYEIRLSLMMCCSRKYPCPSPPTVLKKSILLCPKTQVKYMWIEPKICREDVDGAKKLPASGAKEDCPPCNPGMHLNGTGGTECVYCPVNQFSNGKAGNLLHGTLHL